MSNEVPTFFAETSVRAAGYHWEEAGGHPLGLLIHADEGIDHRQTATKPPALASQPAEQLFRTYDPFDEEPALFRIFAELGPLDVFAGTGRRPGRRDERKVLEFGQALLTFANKYGVPQVDSPPELPVEPSSGRAMAWAIVEMRLAIALWDAVKAKNRKAIASLARRDEECGWRVEFMGYEFTPVGRVTQMFMQEMWPDWSVPCRQGDEFVLAMQILEFLIASRADAKLEFFQPSRGILTLRMRAETLLSAMWLQLAMAIVENKEYRRCDLCGKPFELRRQYRGRQGRDDKQFCDTTCRVKSYQRRRALARKMRSDGEHLRTIAKAVKSDLPTVEGWLGE